MTKTGTDSLNKWLVIDYVLKYELKTFKARMSTTKKDNQLTWNNWSTDIRDIHICLLSGFQYNDAAFNHRNTL